MDPSTGRRGRTGPGLCTADQTAEQYRAALALATDPGMRPLQAHCRLGLGKLYRRTDRVHDACVELSAAVSVLEVTNMALSLP